MVAFILWGIFFTLAFLVGLVVLLGVLFLFLPIGVELSYSPLHLKLAYLGLRFHYLQGIGMGLSLWGLPWARGKSADEFFNDLWPYSWVRKWRQGTKKKETEIALHLKPIDMQLREEEFGYTPYWEKIGEPYITKKTTQAQSEKALQPKIKKTSLSGRMSKGWAQSKKIWLQFQSMPSKTSQVVKKWFKLVRPILKALWAATVLQKFEVHYSLANPAGQIALQSILGWLKIEKALNERAYGHTMGGRAKKFTIQGNFLGLNRGLVAFKFYPGKFFWAYMKAL